MDSSRSLGLSVAAAVVAAIPILLFRGTLDTVVEDYRWAVDACGEPSVGAWGVAAALVVFAWLLLRYAWRLADSDTISPMAAIVIGIWVGIATVVWIVGTLQAYNAVC